MTQTSNKPKPMMNALRWTGGTWMVLLCLFLGFADGSSALGYEEGDTYTVPEEGQPLFHQPTSSLGINQRLTKGAELRILETRGAWLQVQVGGTNGQTGWVQGQRQRRPSRKPVDPDYVRSKTTAKVGTGLVAKGFGKNYGKEHGVSEEDSKLTESKLKSKPFEYEAFESFLAAGQLKMGEPAEDLQQPVEAAPEGTSGKPGSGEEEGIPGNLRRGISASRIRMEMSRDPHYFAKNFTYEEEEEMGFAVAQRIAAGKINDSAALQEYVNLIGSTLVEHSDRSDIPYLFLVLNTPEINAFAAPGGYIFITTGCLAACKNEAELAAVLGHEVAHVARRHAARTLDDHRLKIAKSMLGAQMDKSIEEIYGPMDPNTAALIKELQSMADVHYKMCTAGWGQKFELEADEFGVRYAMEAGWDYSGMLEFLKVLRAGERGRLGAGWDSHPPASERIEALEILAKTEGWKHSGVLLAERFKRFVTEGK